MSDFLASWRELQHTWHYIFVSSCSYFCRVNSYERHGILSKLFVSFAFFFFLFFLFFFFCRRVDVVWMCFGLQIFFAWFGFILFLKWPINTLLALKNQYIKSLKGLKFPLTSFLLLSFMWSSFFLYVFTDNIYVHIENISYSV